MLYLRISTPVNHLGTVTININLSFPSSFTSNQWSPGWRLAVSSLLSTFPALPFPHSSIWRWLGLEITWLQINTPEEFVLPLKSARQVSESRPLCPPTHRGLYNTSLMESDLHCIPDFCWVLATAAMDPVTYVPPHITVTVSRLRITVQYTLLFLNCRWSKVWMRFDVQCDLWCPMQPISSSEAM